MARRKPKSDKPQGGRPPKYADADTLAKAIDAYFFTEVGMPNKAGLCIALRISRDTYNEYKKQFSDTIKRAEDQIEHKWVQRLGGANATGAIFYLKAAMGWKDQQQVDITSAGEKLQITGMVIQKD